MHPYQLSGAEDKEEEMEDARSHGPINVTEGLRMSEAVSVADEERTLNAAQEEYLRKSYTLYTLPSHLLAR